MKPTVAVIIPTYNRGHCVGEAIESVLDQTVPADEIIVVDDGSTDNTPEVLAGFGDRIIVISQVNRGVSAARNAGIARATSEWITFLDSDDVWYPNRISTLLRDVTHSDAGVHVANVDISGPGYQWQYCEIRGVKASSHRADKHSSGFLIMMNDPFAICCSVKRSWIIESGGFDPEMTIHEDFDAFCRLITRGSWLLTSIVIGCLRRVALGPPSLSSLSQSKSVYASAMKVLAYERLLSDSKLTIVQKKIVRKRLSGYRFEHSRALMQDKRAGDARVQLIASAIDYPSLKGWLRAMPPYALGTIGYRIVTRRVKKLKRSEFDCNI